jgi:hypothetical protein
MVEQLKSQLGDNARIVLSADHGFLDTFQGQRHQIRASDPLMTLLRFPPSGDARVFYMHTRKCASNGIREYFDKRLPGRFVILTLDEAESLELFGPGEISPTTRSRMGDLVAISTGPEVIEYRTAGSEGRIALEASQHSGLAPSEMLVPLVIA